MEVGIILPLQRFKEGSVVPFGECLVSCAEHTEGSLLFTLPQLVLFVIVWVFFLQENRVLWLLDQSSSQLEIVLESFTPVWHPCVVENSFILFVENIIIKDFPLDYHLIPPGFNRFHGEPVQLVAKRPFHHLVELCEINSFGQIRPVILWTNENMIQNVDWSQLLLEF
jgi:hypothetical protein